MIGRSSMSRGGAFSFGPFRLYPAQQLLLEGDARIRLGSRALEILTALVERAGEVITKQTLMTRVWPDTLVTDGNLKVHIAALRRALGEGQPGRRYVVTVSGRGYRFVAPVEAFGPEGLQAQEGIEAESAHNLPASVIRIIGRAGVIDTLLRQLAKHRFMTVVGPGGIGKTTVAVAAAHMRVSVYEHGTWFVDLAPTGHPKLVARALASVLGLTTHSLDVTAALIAFLRDKQMLIVLDSCEHVIDEAAFLAEQIINAAPGVHVLATSREPLRARGERLQRLSPLETPADPSSLTAAEALAFPAIQLFVERAAESLEGFELKDADALVVAEICRTLDGIALAIELAATRVDAFGLRELSTLLEDRFRLLRHGRRTAMPRHQSLAAALDWSYELLPEGERTILRRLSVFAGSFTLQLASAIAANDRIPVPDVVDGVGSLVAKSLISADIGGAKVQYRLLDTTRAYARQKLVESGEIDAVLRRHAEHHRDLLERAGVEAESRSAAEWWADHARRVDDVRHALNWAFSPSGDEALGMSLTVAAIPLWTHLSLLEECRACVERALACGKAGVLGDLDDMKLHTALGTALLYVRGPVLQIDVAWGRALEIAERLSDSDYQLRVLWGLSLYRVYVGRYRAALAFARRFRAVAQKKDDTVARLSGDRLIATALHYLGRHTSARRRLDRMLGAYVAPAQSSHIARLQWDQRAVALGTLSVILWLQGFPNQAVDTARSALDEARATNHPLSVCNALGHAAFPIAMYVGDRVTAEQLVTMLLDHSASHGLRVWNAVGRCLRGALLIESGDGAGLSLLRLALDELRDARFGLRYASYCGVLAHGLGAGGRPDEARGTIEDALEWCGRNEERWSMPELLRIRGEIRRLEGSAMAIAAAEDDFRQALEMARRQEALSWELRVATSLARLWRLQGRSGEADDLLSAVYCRFGEGFGTVDLKAARALMLDCRVRGRPGESPEARCSLTQGTTSL
ncbi:putative ATPase/DNA-binding winged helix-turn-helix (wHTH) protein [Inquilinus ginsengisoli]|uniref:ATP-binding protein n=1 Tax=Inquilinus ginsengisoli TaxID=363840 RepID=UPI003D23F1E0